LVGVRSTVATVIISVSLADVSDRTAAPRVVTRAFHGSTSVTPVNVVGGQPSHAR